MEPEFVTLGQLEIEENVVGSSTISYSAPEPIPEHNIEGLRPNSEMPKLLILNCTEHNVLLPTYIVHQMYYILP